MSAFCGMDPAQVRDHARHLQDSSAQVEQLRLRLDAAVHAVAWEGEDAHAFRERWEHVATTRLRDLGEQLSARSLRSLAEADAQDAASRDDAGLPGGDAPRSPGAPGPGADGPGAGDGPLADLAGAASDALGHGLDAGIDLLEGGLDALGMRTEGIAQFQRDADHLGGILEDWVTGERVPTLAELGAASLLTAGSAGVGLYEAATGQDTPFLDDRPGGIVTDVRTEPLPAQGPRTLQDLVVANDALRPGGAAAVEAGQIGIQRIRPADGGESVYLVQVPPTEGSGITEVPGAYGGQGNSRDWGSNLRLVAGQDPAAMDDVRAALTAAQVPDGAEVMIVGHSQGGIIASHLAADPTFNSASGAPGSYDVTHTFSVGSPIQTVVPAQAGTQSVNVGHEASLGAGGFGGDLIAETDLGGLQVDGGHLTAPNRHEVTLDPYPGTSWNPVPVLERNHDTVGPGHDPDQGYAGSVGRATAGDPTLSALQRDLTGTYLGEGTEVLSSQVVTVGRGEP